MHQRVVVRSLALLALTLGILVVVLLVLRPGAGGKAAPSSGPVTRTERGAIDENPYNQFRIPEFSLTDRSGETVTHAALDGELTVVDFFFTSCPLYCPGMTTAMRRVQEETEGTDLRFMSISIDGDIDTPDVIDAYATRYGADPDRWAFLTGDPADVARIVSEGLRFDLGDPSTEDEGRLINHPTRLILLGPDRRVLGLYRYNDEGEVDQLIADALARLEG